MSNGLVHRAVRRTLRRLSPGGAILSFHSVTTREVPAEGVAHIPLEAFKAFIHLVRGLGEIIPLGELVRRHEQGRTTSGLIAVTMDDAYAALRPEVGDFVSREVVPITIFVVTEAAATGARYWWDRIDDLFPQVEPHQWRAFEAACGLPEAYRRGQPRHYGPLRPLRQWLLANHAGRWPSRLEPALRALEEDVGRQTLHRSMTFAELADLATIPWVDVGVHTVSHPVLPLLPDAELRQEIAASYDALRERVATAVPILAIPFGLYDERTLRSARSAGMIASLTLAGNTLNGFTGQVGLPRFCITRDDTRARLGVRLLGWPNRIGPRGPAPYPDLPSATT